MLSNWPTMAATPTNIRQSEKNVKLFRSEISDRHEYLTEAIVTTATFEPILDTLKYSSKIVYSHLLFVTNKWYPVLGGNVKQTQS